MKLLFWFCILASSNVVQNQNPTESPENLAYINSIFTAIPQADPSTTAVISGLNLNPLQPEETDCQCVLQTHCKSAIKENEEEKGTEFIELRFGDDNTCNDIFEICCHNDNITTESIKVKSQPVPTECGIRNVEGAGYRNSANNEDAAEFGEFPWTVMVLVEETQGEFVYKCGGSLIHPRVVLTATHCMRYRNKKYKIRAGEFDKLSDHEILPHEEKNVTTIIRHAEFDRGGLFNDIALLILDSEVTITENVNIVCMPTQNQPIDITKCFASGWGRNINEKKNRDIMKKIELPIVPRDVCEANIREIQNRPLYELHKSFICAGGEAGKGTCKGDGGSPLACPIPGKPKHYYLAGIVSWGLKCGEAIPDIYVNVPLFVDWISDELLKYNIDVGYKIV